MMGTGIDPTSSSSPNHEGKPRETRKGIVAIKLHRQIAKHGTSKIPQEDAQRRAGLGFRITPHTYTPLERKSNADFRVRIRKSKQKN
jgi:hypothetical protein